jgi:hypothetical protein
VHCLSLCELTKADAKVTKAVYNMGRELPKLAGNVVFARAIDDTYTDTNVLWAGELQFEGERGVAPDPLPDGYLMGNAYIGRFRTDVNEAFSVNNHFPAGPNWFSRRNITAGSSVVVSVDVRSPPAGRLPSSRVSAATLIASMSSASR